MTRIKNTGEGFFCIPKRIIFANCISKKSKIIEIAKIKSTRVIGLFNFGVQNAERKRGGGGEINSEKMLLFVVCVCVCGGGGGVIVFLYCF